MGKIHTPSSTKNPYFNQLNNDIREALKTDFLQTKKISKKTCEELDQKIKQSFGKKTILKTI